MQAEKLSISLPADMAQMVRRQVESGAYASNSEVIRDALRMWQERTRSRERRLRSIRAKIDEAAESRERIPAARAQRHFDALHSKALKKASR
jgi:antitoxin ParD1/3/4